MKSGLNLVLDEHGNLHPIILLHPNFREQATNGGYVHEGRLYLRKPYCNLCKDVDEVYHDFVMDMAIDGEWIVSVAVGETNYKNGLISTLLEEYDYMLLPIITETKGKAVQRILEIISGIANIEDGDKVTLCELQRDVVFRVNRADEEPVFISARSLYDEDIKDEEDICYLFEEIIEAFDLGGMSCIELDPEPTFYCSEFCPECGRCEDDDEEWDDDDEWSQDDGDDEYDEDEDEDDDDGFEDDNDIGYDE